MDQNLSPTKSEYFDDMCKLESTANVVSLSLVRALWSVGRGMGSNVMMVQSQMVSSFSIGRRPYPTSGSLQISCDYSCFQIRDVSYQPPGTKTDLLSGVNLSLRENSLGLIFGRSGSGKTTLLQLIAGLCKPTSGSVCIQKFGNDDLPCGTSELLPERVGIVFQFPERYFVAENVLDEVTFGWPPRQRSSQQLKELQKAFTLVGLNSIALDRNPQSLSGGYKRRLALAIQLVQAPMLLLLDEPLAGLDWKARADVVKLLMHLKKKLTLLVVSHDLKELSPLVDDSWRMEMGGTLVREPPADLMVRSGQAV